MDPGTHGRFVAAVSLAALSVASAAWAGEPVCEGPEVSHRCSTTETADSPEAPVVTFSGLRVYEDGSSTVFVTLTAETPVEFSQAGKTLSFVLTGAKVRLQNNQNPLLAKYFHSNVVKVRLGNTRDGVLLTIDLRTEVATHHALTKQGSGAVLRIDVPPPA